MRVLNQTVVGGICSIVLMNQTTGLPEYIRQKMREQNLSAADVARRTGNEISPATIVKIVNGEVSKSGTKTLALIARGLGVSDIEIFRVANGDDVSRPLHFQIYAERFDAGDISDTEWQFIETNFIDYIQKFRLFKQEMQDRAMMPPEPAKGKVVARIEPGKRTEPTKDEVRRMIGSDEINEIERRITPRKKKAG